jgi:hypothetical protein
MPPVVKLVPTVSRSSGRSVTVCVTGADVLGTCVESPPYVALSKPVPVGRNEVVKVAFPLLTGLVPSTFVPSKKVTNPAAFTGETVAVSVTG